MLHEVNGCLCDCQRRQAPGRLRSRLCGSEASRLIGSAPGLLGEGQRGLGSECQGKVFVRDLTRRKIHSRRYRHGLDGRRGDFRDCRRGCAEARKTLAVALRDVGDACLLEPGPLELFPEVGAFEGDSRVLEREPVEFACARQIGANANAPIFEAYGELQRRRRTDCSLVNEALEHCTGCLLSGPLGLVSLLPGQCLLRPALVVEALGTSQAMLALNLLCRLDGGPRLPLAEPDRTIVGNARRHDVRVVVVLVAMAHQHPRVRGREAHALHEVRADLVPLLCR